VQVTLRVKVDKMCWTCISDINATCFQSANTKQHTPALIYLDTHIMAFIRVKWLAIDPENAEVRYDTYDNDSNNRTFANHNKYQYKLRFTPSFVNKKYFSHYE